MIIPGKTLNEVIEYFKKDDSFVSLKLMVENEQGAVYRLKYLDEVYIQSYWENRTREQTSWLVVQNDMMQCSFSQYRVAKSRIGIESAPRRAKPIVRCEDAKAFDEQLCRDAREFGDKANCGIRAYCNLTKTPYAEGRELCKKYGWDHSGMYTHDLLRLLKDQGWIIEDKTQYIREHAKTIKSFEKQGFRENYLIHVHRHFVSSVNGTITDWSAGQRKIITDAWRVSKK